MFKKILRVAASALACLALTGCFLQAGKFDSTLDLRKDGTFTFAYKGQIYLLALSKFADMSSKAEADSAFVQQSCHGDDFNERKCTSAEIAELTGWSKTGTKVRAFRARLRLKAIADDWRKRGRI